MHVVRRVEPLSPEAQLALAPEVRSWKGEASLLVAAHGKTWVVKIRNPADRKRELAVSTLGRGLVNVVETRSMSARAYQQLIRMGAVDESVDPETLVLSRLASSYRASELPARTLDAAIGGEMCFSLWVRRRDPHVWNRAFTPAGLPVFFDLHASLDFEPDLRSREKFFAQNLHGYGGAWRIREDASPSTSTRASRAHPDITTFAVNSIEGAHSAATNLIPGLRQRARTADRILSRAGLNGAEVRETAHFLRETAEELPQALEQMWQVARSHVPTPPLDGLVPEHRP